MAIVTTAFDSADYLRTPEAIQEYLADAFESEDPRVISHAIGVVARATGMSKVSDSAELSRQALYKALSPEGNPEFSTIIKVMHALGFRLSPERIPEFA